MESPEAPHHHAGHTGHRWFDIALGVSAMFVSVVTLFVAIEHGRTMERMADANMRMVEANSWPFVAFDTHNVGEKGGPQVRLVLTNEGIGPARIETFELWWKGKPISSPGQLLNTCCVTSPDPANNHVLTSVGLASPRILRAGEHVDFFSLDYSAAYRDLFETFNRERDYLKTRICYCSVFDECWTSQGGGELFLQDQSKLIHPQRVNSCPKPPVPYQVAGTQ